MESMLPEIALSRPRAVTTFVGEWCAGAPIDRDIAIEQHKAGESSGPNRSIVCAALSADLRDWPNKYWVK
jgi:hypothetical protein